MLAVVRLIACCRDNLGLCLVGDSWSVHLTNLASDKPGLNASSLWSDNKGGIVEKRGFCVI
jgi:hypothetical protein